MPSIDIRRPHQLSLDEAHALVDKVATRMREKFEITSQWAGQTLSFQRPGVQGQIVVGEKEIHVQAKLGMLLAPLKGMVEQEIRRKLDEHFA
jgi:putative polyhydroxyalkanoate system protein